MFDKFREECGVFGIYGHPEASKLAYLGLYALQHRGQESAGIAVGRRRRACAPSAQMGYVNEIFDAGRRSRRCPGTLAIGHTRYSTAGESKLSNAQPILIDCVHGQVGICHNGNIVNADEMRERAGARRARSSRPTATPKWCCTSTRGRRPASVEDALVESIAQLTGAFSFALITKDQLIAVRDPHGFRPLALGRLGDAWVVCSETCALDLIGATYVRDVEPGEVLIIGPHGAAVDQAVPAGAAVALHLRARLFRAARQRGVRPERQRSAHQPRPRARARDRRRRPTWSCRFPTRASARRSATPKKAGDPDALRADPQSLRRPHVHRAGAVDPPLRREGEAQPGAQHPRRASAWC